MNKWIIGARIKTLPAAFAPVLVGTSYASEVNFINAFLALAVALFLQIGVNYANDFSDGIRGTDRVRIGPTRLVASGLASAKSVKIATYISFVIAAIAGLGLAVNVSLWLIAVGAISIIAAWGYTGGKKPYGYLGFGEVSVFLFFGVIATVGSYYVQTEALNWQIFLLSLPIGALSCAILVINNLRDLPQDAKMGKKTLAVRVGDQRTRLFYTLLLLTAQLSALSVMTFDPQAVLTLICLPLAYQAYKQVMTGITGQELIPLLGRTSRLQLLIATSLAVAFVI